MPEKAASSLSGPFLVSNIRNKTPNDFTDGEAAEFITPAAHDITSVNHGNQNSTFHGFDGLATRGEITIGDKPEGTDIDRASTLVDQVCEFAINARIFAWTADLLLNPVDEQARPAVAQHDCAAVGGADVDRPFLAFGPAEVEAGVKWAVRDFAGEVDLGGNGSLGIGWNAKFG